MGTQGRMKRLILLCRIMVESISEEDYLEDSVEGR
jgi:hypothetical protein